MRLAKKILLNVNNFTMSKGLTPKFMFKLESPPNIKTHPTLRVKLSKPFEEHILWPNRKIMIRLPRDFVRGYFEY